MIARAEEVEPDGQRAVPHVLRRGPRRRRATAEARYLGNGEPPRPLEGIPTAIKEEEAVAGAAVDAGLADLQGPVADDSSAVRASGPRRRARSSTPATTAPSSRARRSRTRELRGVTRNPWNPRVRRRRLLGRLRRRAGRGHDDAGQRLGHRRLDPHPGAASTAWSASSRRTAACRRTRRSTSTSTATAGRWRARSPTARCSRTCSPAPHPHDHVSLRPKLEIRRAARGVEGLRVARRRPISAAGRSTPRSSPTRSRRRRRCARAGAVVEEVDLDGAARDVMPGDGDPLPPDLRRRIGGMAREHGDLMTDYAVEFARWCERGGGGRTMLEGLELRGAAVRAGGRAAGGLRRADLPDRRHARAAAGDGYVGRGIEVGGDRAAVLLRLAIPTPVFNIMSRCPVLAVPSGFGDNGVPTGVQIVGRTYDDVTAFRVGAALERSGRGRSVPRRSSRSGHEHLRSDAQATADSTSARVAVVAMNALLEIDELGAELEVEGERRPVLSDVSLRIGEGEALGLVGESGSGKSMTARAVARLLPPGAKTTGAVRFDGTDVLALGGGALRALPRAGGDDLPGPARPREPGPPDRRLHDRGAAPARRAARGGASGAPSRRWATWASTTGRGGSSSTRTSSPAGCCSGS